MTEPATHKFETLDAMRGIAAIAVMLFHYQGTILGGLPRGLLFSGGYLAVDLFFVLSGFVIAHAYDGRLAATMTAGTFVRLRLVRLMPMIWLGALLGASFMLFSLRRPPNEIAWVAPLNAFIIPTWTSISPDLFPINAPAWSLLFELIANIAFALMFRHLGTTRLLGVMAISVPFLVFAAFTFGSLNGGSRFDD